LEVYFYLFIAFYLTVVFGPFVSLALCLIWAGACVYPDSRHVGNIALLTAASAVLGFCALCIFWNISMSSSGLLHAHPPRTSAQAGADSLPYLICYLFCQLTCIGAMAVGTRRTSSVRFFGRIVIGISSIIVLLIVFLRLRVFLSA